MLRINVHKSAAHVVEYFMGKPGKRETLAPGGQVMATWGGTLIDTIAIDPENVTREDFSALCNNLDPMTGGERLTRRTKANRRVGYDINFHPSKSVSVLYALTPDARILECFPTCGRCDHAGDRKARSNARADVRPRHGSPNRQALVDQVHGGWHNVANKLTSHSCHGLPTLRMPVRIGGRLSLQPAG